MLEKPAEIPDALWMEIETVLIEYQGLLHDMVAKSTGVDDHSLILLGEKFKHSMHSNDIWDVLETHYPHLIHMINMKTITPESLKRGAVSSYYNAALEVATLDGYADPEFQAYHQTIDEFSDELFHYIELFPSFIEDSKNLYIQQETFTL